ncbi:secreted protein containing DUF1812 [Bacteroides sp. CAG:1076]|jgi:hypothetical protein|nr:secreted protein containing DUF1812 [Bacteroides sp. CAG:1076]
MNRLYKKITFALCFSLLGLFSSCIYENEVDCPCEVRFVYDYNMEFADAFPSQVNDVMLFIFDDDGRFISSLQDSGPHLDAGYRMPLQLVPGHYQLVAWAGLLTDTDCYNLNCDLQRGTSTVDDLMLCLQTEEDEYDQCLTDVWHGQLADFEVKADAPSYATISLVKDVKRFRVLLQDTEGNALSKDDYSFGITTANRMLDHQNEPCECEPLVYRPHTLVEATISNDAAPTRATDLHALVAELNTLRLTDDVPVRFTVRNEREQQDLFDIDLQKYLNLMKLEVHADMSLQEYLDRESSYQVILIMGHNNAGQEVMMSIQINAWTLVFNQTEL